MKTILPRKIISASVSGTIFAIILGFTQPVPIFDKNLSTIQNYLLVTSTIIPIYMMYILPAILIYGVFTSIISDKVGEFVASKVKEKKVEHIVSGVLHIIFGLILFSVSLGASILFFITDRILGMRYKKYKWLEVIKSLTIPVLAWLLFMGIVWVNDIF
ncbi:hypothetical protein [Neobacillus mesonae]|uniref:hypothetical protein n=1 Tax=Neobacillus mesonae TaxID=1193713 RepID=UPI00203EA795|nr:hypothetical protein [Neobacillus mesonae]MCM3570624.1 hypothetical protein [Neobacillus mesonae]